MFWNIKNRLDILFLLLLVLIMKVWVKFFEINLLLFDFEVKFFIDVILYYFIVIKFFLLIFISLRGFFLINI